MNALLSPTLVFTMLLALLLPGAFAAPAFDVYSNFPEQAGNPFSTPEGVALPDGRLIVWNGLDIYLQTRAGVDLFEKVAGGYEGDPAFLSLSPDGNTLLLGAGGFTEDYTGNLYLFDALDPKDYDAEGAPAANLSHFSGAHLTEQLVLIDTGSWPDSVLMVHDLAAKSAPVAVLAKPAAAKADVVVEKPGYSSGIGVDRALGRVYVMDGNTLELRHFQVSDLIDAYGSGTMLDWATDGTAVGAAGQYYSGGVSGITPEGDLIIGGSLGWLMPGGVQRVDPETGDILETYDPSGVQEYTKAIYNPVTGQTTYLTLGVVYASGMLESLPAAGLAGLLALTVALGLVGVRRRRV